MSEQEERKRATRDHLFGLWAARQLGLDGGDALVYAFEVKQADIEGGERAMVSKIIGDFMREQADINPDTVEHFLRGCEVEAGRRLTVGH